MEAYMHMDIWVRGEPEKILTVLKDQEGLAFHTDDPDMVEYITTKDVQFDAYKIDDPEKSEKFQFSLAENGQKGLFIRHSFWGALSFNETLKRVQKCVDFRDSLERIFADITVLSKTGLETD